MSTTDKTVSLRLKWIGEEKRRKEDEGCNSGRWSGNRISEESHLKPKPMIEIGGRPILWHIMKYYSEFGFHDFVICLGYKQYVSRSSLQIISCIPPT